MWALYQQLVTVMPSCLRTLAAPFCSIGNRHGLELFRARVCEVYRHNNDQYTSLIQLWAHSLYPHHLHSNGVMLLHHGSHCHNPQSTSALRVRLQARVSD